MKIMQIVSCLELMTNLFFLFIMVEFKSYYIQPPLKNGTLFFFCYESVSKGCNVLNEFMFQSHMRFCLT